MAKFFSWDPERDGFELHETAEAARESAEGAIDWYLDDEWDESVEGVCWGEVLGDVTQTITGDCDCPLDDDGTSPHAHHCRYEIEDVENTTADDLRSQLAAANKRIEKLQNNRRVDREVVENAEMTLVKLAEMERERDEALAREAGLRIQLQDRIEAVEHLSGDRNRWKSIAEALRTDLRSERKRADEAIRSKRTTRERLTNLHAAAKQENARLMEQLTGLRRRWESRRKHWRDNAGDFARGAEKQIGYVVGEIDDVLAACEEKP